MLTRDHTVYLSRYMFVHNGNESYLPLWCSVLYTHTQPFNGRWSRTTQVGRYQKKLANSHPSWSSDILYQLPPFPTIHSILWVQFTCLTTSFQVLFGLPLGLGPSTSYSIISSPIHYLIFTAHAHTNAACSAVIPMLCHLYLVSLSVPYLGICLLA